MPASSTLPVVTLACDGACSGNPGPGGWGVVLQCGELTREWSGSAPNTTNSRMELTAALEGFRALKRPCAVTVISDSQYLIHPFTQGWLATWQSNGWRKANRNPVENQDLWEALLVAVAPHTVMWTWTRGHADHLLNTRADALARQGVRSAQPVTAYGPLGGRRRRNAASAARWHAVRPSNSPPWWVGSC